MKPPILELMERYGQNDLWLELAVLGAIVALACLWLLWPRKEKRKNL